MANTGVWGGDGANTPLLAQADDNVRPSDYGSTDDVGAEADTESVTDSASTDSEVQEGVRRIEAVARTWSKTALIVAYMSVFLMAFTTSLEGQVTYPLAAFAVSSFNHHSLLSTVYVVQNVVNGIEFVYPG